MGNGIVAVTLAHVRMLAVIVALGSNIAPVNLVAVLGHFGYAILGLNLERWSVELNTAGSRNHILARIATPPAFTQVEGVDTAIPLMRRGIAR